MNFLLQIAVALTLLLGSLYPSSASAKDSVTIVRDSGRTGFIDNSLVATTVAVEKNADYLELPVQLSADNQPVIYKEVALGSNTNVADLFPIRTRKDGRYYLVDFTLSELQQIRQVQATGSGKAPLQLPISSLFEILGLMNRLNEGRLEPTGIVLDITQPSFYTKEKKDLGTATVQTLADAGYTSGDKIFIESGDPDELQKISHFIKATGMEKFPLIQKVETKEQNESEGAEKTSVTAQDNGWLFTHSGLRILASYANALALPAEVLKGQTFTAMDIGTFIKGLRNYNIKIFAMTENGEPVQLPPAPQPAGEVIQIETTDNSVDGLYINSFRRRVEEQSPEIPPVFETTPPKEQTSSTLPPFFSNLGLKKPDNTTVSKTLDQLQSPQVEQTESNVEESPASWD